MFRFFGRHKKFFVGFIFISLLIFLSFFSGKSNSPNFLEHLSYRIVSPFSGALRWVSDSVSNAYHRYIDLRSVREENQRLKEEITELKKKLHLSKEENFQILRRLGSFEKLDLDFSEGVVGQVVGHDPNSFFRSVTIDVGTGQGIEVGQVVVADGGIVGRVRKVGERTAQVLLITDPRSVVDVLDARTRARGSLIGGKKKLTLDREHWLTQAEYIFSKEEVKPGDLLITSGMDSLFPKGIPAGTIRSVEKDKEGLFWKAEVLPVVEMNKLEEVMVLKEKADL